MLSEQLELVAEAGDVEDALELMRELINDSSQSRRAVAINIRRLIKNGDFDKAGMRQLAEQQLEVERRAKITFDTIVPKLARATGFKL